MLAGADSGFSLATEIADFLVRAGVPFANAHEAAGKCVHACETQGKKLHELSDAEFEAIHSELSPKVRDVLTVEGAVKSRSTVNGTAPSSVFTQISTLTSKIDQDDQWIADKSTAFSGMMGS